MAEFILLNVPWGLIGPSTTRKKIPNADSALGTDKAVSPLLFCDDDQDVFLNGRRETLECFARIRTRLHERQVLFDLPVPLYASEPQRLRHATWRSELEFTWSHAVDRPKVDGVDTPGQREPGGPAYQFMLAVFARMHDFEAAQSDAAGPWEFVLERWLSRESRSDPTMDILVRHAREHRSRWVDISEHPRRVLNRQRELVALSRVQDLDTWCMQWLARQPGNSLVQRAGGRQRILALSRYENRNTLENKVFRDLLDRTVSAAREYLVTKEARVEGAATRRTARYALVQQYQRECHRLSIELAEQGVSRVPEIFQPNYVLLHDSRYKHVWTAWQDVIRRKRSMDDLWRWQRKSWAEFCKACLVQALFALPRSHLVAGSPLFFRTEHRRGEWLLHDDPLVVVAHEEEQWIVEVLSADASDVRDIMKEFGASVWLRISNYKNYENNDYKYMPVWAVHTIGQDTVLRELVDSANEAFQRFRDRSKLAGGVVLLAAPDPNNPIGLQASEFVTGLEFGPWYQHLVDALNDLGDKLAELIREALV